MAGCEGESPQPDRRPALVEVLARRRRFRAMPQMMEAGLSVLPGRPVLARWRDGVSDIELCFSRILIRANMVRLSQVFASCLVGLRRSLVSMTRAVWPQSPVAAWFTWCQAYLHGPASSLAAGGWIDPIDGSTDPLLFTTMTRRHADGKPTVGSNGARRPGGYTVTHRD